MHFFPELVWTVQPMTMVYGVVWLSQYDRATEIDGDSTFRIHNQTVDDGLQWNSGSVQPDNGNRSRQTAMAGSP